MSITSIGAAPPVRFVAVTPASAQPIQAPAFLAPAVRVDIRSQDQGADIGGTSRAGLARTPDPAPEAKAAATATEPRIRIDRETKAVVYQEVDPNSGDVIVQLPDPVVLKARAYAEAVEARTRATARPLDRTA